MLGNADGGEAEKGLEPAYEKNPFSRPASTFIRLCRRLRLGSPDGDDSEG